jgi:hypothetical protein
MNQIPVQQKRYEGEECDPFTRVVSGLGTALFFFGIFVPGAHSLVMPGLALLTIAYVL